MQPIDSINRTACTRRARRSEKASISRRKLARRSRRGTLPTAQHASGVSGSWRLPEPPNLFLIEEPENGIYPKRLGQVI